MLREKAIEKAREDVKKAVYKALKEKALAQIDETLNPELEGKRPHLCAACGAAFKRKVDLYTHKYENLWEDYLTERHKHGRPYLCTFCGESFLTKDDFLEHWFMEDDHEDYALTFLQMGQTKQPDPDAEWMISPTEEILLERRIRHDSEMKAVKKKRSAGNYISETIAFRVENNEMIVAECWGIPGSGKSHSIVSLIYTNVIPEAYKRLVRDWLEKTDENYAAAIIYRDEQRASGRDIGLGYSAIELMKRRGIWREPLVHITFSVAETLRAIREAKELDVIMQDEDPGLMGRGSETAKTKIQTILKLMRKKRISFFFISPVRIQYITTGNLAFEVTHKKNPLTARITRGILYDREHVSLGWYQHKILEADERLLDVRLFNLATRASEEVLEEHLEEGKLTIEQVDSIKAGAELKLPVLLIYEILKDSNLDKIHYQMGAEGVEVNWAQVDEDVDAVYEGLLKRTMEMHPDKDSALRILSEMPVSRILRRVPAFGIKGEVEYQTLVAEETVERIQREMTEHYMKGRFPDDDTNITGGVRDGGDAEPERATMPETFSLADADYLPIVKEEAQMGKFKIDMKYIDAFERYMRKEADWKDYALVAASLGLTSPGNISEQFQRITGRISQLRGGLFEIEILKQYLQTGMTVSVDPKPILKYPEGMAPEGQPDRKIVLISGKIRICAWKCYGGNNPTIELGRKRDSAGGVFVPCPEILDARRMIEMGANPEMLEVVVEGIMGKREKLPDGSGFRVVPEYFRKEVDPYTDDHSVTITKRERIPYPPTVEQLTGIVPKKKEEPEDKPEKEMIDSEV
jgi:hypothetical protein